MDTSVSYRRNGWIREVSYIAAIGAILAVFVVKHVLAAFGFAENGVIADTFAARWQAMGGRVQSGSLFAKLQAAGAGLGLKRIAIIGLIGAFTALCIALYISEDLQADIINYGKTPTKRS